MSIRDITVEVLSAVTTSLTAVEICAHIKKDRNRVFVDLLAKYGTEKKVEDEIYKQAVRVYEKPANTLARSRLKSDYRKGSLFDKSNARFWVGELIGVSTTSQSDDEKVLADGTEVKQEVPEAKVASETQLAADLTAPPPDRVITTVSRIVRDTALSARIKLLHNHQCQICGESVVLADGTKYVEGHHLRPLGIPHNGCDRAENIVCLCPNHHAACDFGAIRLDLSALRTVKSHQIHQKYLDYHNNSIFRG